eukprot:GILI01006532.1.p1 GENE.GILI01006532.1~~GILI01006532.1.p1  ORF type:complete len:585 (+),score=100.15 GILI01006532.1:97-1851(+)
MQPAIRYQDIYGLTMDLSLSSDTFARGASTPKQPSNSSSYISGNDQRRHPFSHSVQQSHPQHTQWLFAQQQQQQQTNPNFMSVSGRSTNNTYLTSQGSTTNFGPGPELAPLSFSSQQSPPSNGTDNTVFGENHQNAMAMYAQQMSTPPPFQHHPMLMAQPQFEGVPQVPQSYPQHIQYVYAVPGLAPNTMPMMAYPHFQPNGFMAMPPAAQQMTAPRSATATTATGTIVAQRPPSDVRLWGFAVCDPQHSYLQRVPVPYSVCAPTKGLLTYDNDVQNSSTKPCSSTICVAYTQGTCPFGTACPHFHVDKAYLERARAVQEPLCCAFHNDYFSQEIIASNIHPALTNCTYALVQEDRSIIELSPALLAFTAGLDHLPAKGKGTPLCRHINAKKLICRLHLEGKCKWTKDCSRIHVCRDAFKHLMTTSRVELMDALMPSTPSPAMAQRLLSFQGLLQTPASLPLVSMLLDSLTPSSLALKGAVIEALAMIGAFFSQEQAHVIHQIFGIDVPVGQRVTVKPMLQKFFEFKALNSSAAQAIPSIVQSPMVSTAAVNGHGFVGTPNTQTFVPDLYSSPLEGDDIFAPIA